MKHASVLEHGWIEQYRQGTMGPEEEERFEAHLMDCAECQEELLVEHSFSRGMKTLAVQEAARATVGSGLLAWFLRRRSGLALVALVVCALGVSYLTRENARLARRIAELAAAEPPAGILARPLAEVSVVVLGVRRGPGSGPVTVRDSGRPWSLAVDAGADPRITSYSVTLLDDTATPRYERDGLRPNDLEVIQLTFPSGFLPPGEYLFRLAGTWAGGESAELGSYPFRLAGAD